MNDSTESRTEGLLAQCARESASRTGPWTALARRTDTRSMAEAGVFRAEFAASTPAACAGIRNHHLLDPWRHLAGWNKPANVDDSAFEGCYRQTRERTAFAAERRTILRGTTSEVAAAMPERSLELAYIDGGHTLRGITIDLARLFSRVRPGGYIGGDDFTPSTWRHSRSFEPSMVFPCAVHFAEARRCPVFGLPGARFVIVKRPSGFRSSDLTGRYPSPESRSQLLRRRGRRWKDLPGRSGVRH